VGEPVGGGLTVCLTLPCMLSFTWPVISYPTCPPRSLFRNTGDGIDYGQRNYDCLGELIADTLSLFEAKGGDDAFINIK